MTQRITVKPESSEDSVSPKNKTYNLCSFLNMYLLGEKRKGAFSKGDLRGKKLSQVLAHPRSSYHIVWPFPRLLHALFLVHPEKPLGSPPSPALVPCRADPCCPGRAAYRPAFVYLPMLEVALPGQRPGFYLQPLDGECNFWTPASSSSGSTALASLF